MSPEVFNSEPYTFSSDIWALGVMIYKMCMKTLPFGENVVKIIRGEYSPVTRYSPGLQNLVHACLKVDPKKRPTAKEIYNLELLRPYIPDWQ